MSEGTPGNPAARELGYCPCCGYLTLPEGEPGSYEVCPVCHWIDDPRQFVDEDCPGEANEVTLAQARKNVEEVGAASPEVAAETREPAPGECRDPNWPY
jgi:hypothetical protein